jgi:hypothetical protein
VAQENDSSDERAGDLVINEVFPDPAGADEAGEFIELYNPTEYEISLHDLWLDDVADAGSKQFNLQGVIKPEEFKVIRRTESGIALNNARDEVVLGQADVVIDKVVYENAPTDASYQRFDTTWEWSTEITSGEENQRVQLDVFEEDKNEQIQEIETVPLENLDESYIDKEVLIAGVVSVDSSIVGSGTIYLQSFDGGAGIQVNYPKSLPVSFEQGDLLQLQGVVGTRYDELRVKIQKLDDIQLQKTSELVVNAMDKAVAVDDVGRVIRFSGKLIEAGRKNIVIVNEQAEYEVDTRYFSVDAEIEDILDLVGLVQWRSGQPLIHLLEVVNVEKKKILDDEKEVENDAKIETPIMGIIDDDQQFPGSKVFLIALVVLVAWIISRYQVTIFDTMKGGFGGLKIWWQRYVAY